MGEPALVGNDVVDLCDPHNATAHLRERFVRRILDDGEQSRLERAASPQVLLAQLFAAKEAAYKVLVKLRPGAVLAHRRFRVSPGLDELRVDGLGLGLRIVTGDGWVHAIASPDNPREAFASVVEIAASEDPSRRAREALIAALAARLGKDPADLVVRRPARLDSWDGFAPPEVWCEEELLGAQVSLSHDGRFVAFAACLPRSDDLELPLAIA